jgi:hypothetical protein
LLALRAGGMGLAMMPVMTGGVAAVPTRQVGAASAFNNVAQRSAAALGLAILTALMTSQQAAMLQDRTALIGADTPMPGLMPGPSGEMVGMYAVYQQTSLQVFAAALDQLMVITAALTLVGVALAFLLRSGPAPKSPDSGSAASAAH